MSEAELQEKIKNKLERKYGAGNVWINAGIAEHGVDIIFMLPAGDDNHNGTEFGENLFIGIQLKVEDPMGAGGAQKAIGQAAVAFGHRFPIVDEDGRCLHLVYIMNYGNYQPQAREYLADARNSLRGLKWFSKNDMEPYLVDADDITNMLSENDNG